MVPVAGRRAGDGMSSSWFLRPAYAVLAAGMLTAGIAMLFAGRAETPARAGSLYTIEVLDSGFNPEVCVINRLGDRVRWHNRTSKPVYIWRPDPNSPENPVIWDVGEVPPGGFSTELMATGNHDWPYEDKYTGRTGKVIVPISNNAAADCSPRPPTPTPTNTPTRTPTRTATPAFTPFSVPPRCIGVAGCAVAIDIARGE
jgi:hypothetical protein